jgi:hypothetical protein
MIRYNKSVVDWFLEQQLLQEKTPIIISVGNHKYKYKDAIQIVKCDNNKITVYSY